VAASEGERGIAAASLRAVDCALAIQTGLHGYQISDGLDLLVRVGVGASRVAAVHLGGLGGRWELVLTGSALAQGLVAEGIAQPGQVVVSPRVWSVVGAHVCGHPLADGYHHIEALAPAEPPGDDRITAAVRRVALARPPVAADTELALRGYVSAAVSTRLAAGQSAWLAELRRVVGAVRQPADAGLPDAAGEAQQVMAAFQQIVQGFEGSINYVSVDNTGATMMAVFGLPPLAHEDDAVRAIDAAQQLRTVLKRLGWQTVMGVASGKAFCGSVGERDALRVHGARRRGQPVGAADAGGRRAAADPGRQLHLHGGARALPVRGVPADQREGQGPADRDPQPGEHAPAEPPERAAAVGAGAGGVGQRRALAAGRPHARASGPGRQAARAAARAQRDGRGRGRGGARQVAAGRRPARPGGDDGHRRG
jgi:hypothetical protein